MRLKSFAETVCVAFLGVWLGAVVLSGVTAAVAFPAMRELAPHLPRFEKYPNPHYIIAAGAIARRVFDIGAMVQYVCAAVSGAAALVSIAAGSGRPILRFVWVLLAIAALIYWRAGLSPRMDANLDDFLVAAKSGDLATAERHKDAFDRDHPLASRVLSAAALFLLCALVESARKSLTSAPRAGNQP